MDYLDNYFKGEESIEKPFELKENEVLLFCLGCNINDCGINYPKDLHENVITGISEVLIPFESYIINEPGYYGRKVINDINLSYFKKVDYPGVEVNDGVDYILEIDKDLHIYENIKRFNFYILLKAEIYGKNNSVKNIKLLRKKYVRSEGISKDSRIKITHTINERLFI